MKKLTLLTTTALVAGYMSFATPANAAEDGWFASMTQSVQTWFAGEPETSAEVETYLDEVTIAVPPMTGAEAAAIQPAAGDYVEDEVVIETPAYNTTPAPGSMQYQNETSFNTEIDGTQNATVAFGDTPSADDLANIMPAAGDAEEMNDEAVVVVEADTEAKAEMSNDNSLDVAPDEMSITADVVETTNDAMDATANMADDAAESMDDAMDATVDTTTDMANDAADTIDETVVTPAEQAIQDYTDEKELEMDVNVDVNENVTTGTNVGDVGADASVKNNVELNAED